MEQHQFPATRRGLTRKFNCGLDVYLTVNLKPDGDPGEIFVKLGKPGTAVSGLMHAFALTVSAALQRGVPWSDFILGNGCWLIQKKEKLMEDLARSKIRQERHLPIF